MGAILGLGITHYPGFTARRAMPVSLPRVLKDPGLPERLRSPDAWPEAMRREWAEDQGAAFGERHRREVVAALRRARAALEEFQPDFIVLWGDDQHENFHADFIPPFAVLAFDAFEVQPWAGKGPSSNAWDEPEDRTFRMRGHREGAKWLATALVEEDFDLAYAYRPLHHRLAHAFTNSVLFLDWDRRGFDWPIVPFAVNCYGRRVIATRGYMESLTASVAEADLDPPSPSPARCFDLGAACARLLRVSPWRVAVIASSSWSHSFLTRKNWYLYPDLEADRRLYEALRRGDYAAWRSTPLAQTEASGQHEMLNWFCLAGAMAELDRRPDSIEFFESSIMTSNKVIATFRP